APCPACRPACGWHIPACGSAGPPGPGRDPARAARGAGRAAAARRSCREAAAGSGRGPCPTNRPGPWPARPPPTYANAGGDGGYAWAARRSAVFLAQQLLQGWYVDQTNFTLIDADQTFACKTREQAAGRFQGEAQVVADFLAAHAQHELGGGVAQRRVALRQVQQEGRQPLFGAHGAQRGEHLVRAPQLAAHEAAELVLQRRQVAGD